MASPHTDTLFQWSSVTIPEVFGSAFSIKLPKLLLVCIFFYFQNLHSVVQDAKQIKDLKEQGDETRIQEIFRDAHHKEFKFKLLAKPDNYQGNSRIKIQAIRAVPINYTNDSKDLLNLLETYSQKDSIQSE